MTEPLAAAQATATVLIALFVAIFGLLRLLGKGESSGLTEGQREALHGTATNVRELRRTVDSHASILAAIAETQKMQGARFNEYLRALEQGFPKYVCRAGDVETTLRSLHERVYRLEEADR